MKNLIIYHRVDFDGLFSYVIAKKAVIGDIEGFGYNYGDDLTLLPDFENYDRIFMVDITLPAETMIAYSNKITWIDHHITAINESIERGYNKIEGIRRDGTAACELCWEYFHKDECPYAVQLVGAADVWQKDRFPWETEVQAFQFGLRAKKMLDPDNLEFFWDGLMDRAICETYIDCGQAIKDYFDDLQKSWCDRFAFEVEVAGKYKGIAMLCPQFTSRVFDSMPDYDLFIIAEKDGKKDGCYRVSMYGGDNLEGFSCGEYMKENFGGGGHKCAAGGIMNVEQFNKLVRDKKI